MVNLDTKDGLTELFHNPMKGTIAFLDYLGFDELIENFPLVGPAMHVKTLSELTDKAVDHHKDLFSISGDKVRMIRVSDSIVLHTTDDSELGTIELIVKTLELCKVSLYCSMPIRGAITRDELWWDEETNSIIGKAVSKAVRMEKSQDWMGVLVDINSLRRGAFDDRAIRDFQESGILVDYDEIPIKDKKPQRGTVLGWPNSLPVDSKDVETRLVENSPDADDQVQIKQQNTIKFMQFFEKKYGGTPFAPKTGKLPYWPNIHPKRWIHQEVRRSG